MPPRRCHWQLCGVHSRCLVCKSAVDSWKQKAQRSGWNASRLKYALECVLSEQNEVIYDISGMDALEPITTGMDVEPGPDDILNWSCGICKENHCKVGPTVQLYFLVLTVYVPCATQLLHFLKIVSVHIVENILLKGQF
jgi:hypothetical protein